MDFRIDIRDLVVFILFCNLENYILKIVIYKNIVKKKIVRKGMFYIIILYFKFY